MKPVDDAPKQSGFFRLTWKVAGPLRWQSRPHKEALAKPQKKKSRRKRLYDLHAWVGFHLAVIMFVVLFTGTFATISNELDWLATPAMRVTPDGDQVSWQAMVDAVKEDDPTRSVVDIAPGEGDHFAYKVRVVSSDGIMRTVHVNQWTGEVTGQSTWYTFQYFFRNLHRYLFLPSTYGLTIVSSMAVILIVSLYTGLKTSRNWRTLMTRIRFSKGARTAIGDAHKAAGLWSLWFFALMISTGLWYYAEFLSDDFEPEYPRISEERAASLGDVIVDPEVPDILHAAKTAYPELKVTSVTFGGLLARSATMVHGSAGNPIVRDRANRVYLDPVTLDIIHVARDRDLGWVQWLNQIADPLHFGNFAGLPVKLIWFTFGLFLTGLSISGVWLTWRRLKLRGASRVQLLFTPILLVSGVYASLHYAALNLPFGSGIALFEPAWFIVGLWLGGLALIGLWFLIKRLRRAGQRRFTIMNSIYAILICAAGGSAVHATILQKPFAEPVERKIGVQFAGPIKASLFMATKDQGAFAGSARMVIAGVGGRPNLKQMTVRLKNGDNILGDEDSAIKRRFNINALVQPYYFRLPADDLALATELEAILEMKSGSTFTLSWPLAHAHERKTVVPPGIKGPGTN